MASTRVAGIDGEQLASLRGDLRIAASAIPADDLQSARRRFLALLERPQSVGFSIGWIDPFVQLGPAFLDDRLVMLPSCVTNFSATCGAATTCRRKSFRMSLSGSSLSAWVA